MALSSILNFQFREYIAMVRVGMHARNMKIGLRDDQEDLKFCYDILQDAGRSFAAVTIQLNSELRDAVCIFYLVLRALDTIEDDMSIPIEEKKKRLPKFHEHLKDTNWSITGIGKGCERTLLEQYYRVSREYNKLKPEFQEVIADICHKMSLGMCHFLENVVVTKDDYNLYCHYVAGLVGQGLSRLFSLSGLEDEEVGSDSERANIMGLFLQKINIIRDYYEDICEDPPRIFWPKDIWRDYGQSMKDFKDPSNRNNAMKCLHAMIADALSHIPVCIEYLAALKEPSVFLFCAIPQVMAIASLATLYNNEEVFAGNKKVKIRKGLACKIIMNCGNMRSAMAQFKVHLDELDAALLEEDPSYDISKKRIAEGLASLAPYVDQGTSFTRTFLTAFPALGGRLLFAVVDSVSGYFRPAGGHLTDAAPSPNTAPGNKVAAAAK